MIHQDISEAVSNLKNLEEDSDHFNYLVRNGVNRSDLEKFIRDGRPLKRGIARDARANIPHILDALFHLGGHVAGGGAVARIFKTHRPKDYDVFFNDQIAYTKAVLMVQDNPYVDICFFSGNPYDSFDLDVSKCSFQFNTFDVSIGCLEAIETGISAICPKSIVNANLTMERMKKYNTYMGMKFKRHEVLAMCSSFNVDVKTAEFVLKNLVLLYSKRIMKPNAVAQELRRIASRLEASKSPDKYKVVSSIKGLLNHVAAGELLDVLDELTPKDAEGSQLLWHAMTALGMDDWGPDTDPNEVLRKMAELAQSVGVSDISKAKKYAIDNFNTYKKLYSALT